VVLAEILVPLNVVPDAMRLYIPTITLSLYFIIAKQLRKLTVAAKFFVSFYGGKLI